ncbi:uncharacterized protein LOC127832344 isoform X3 [Dreissena polymorpha]|uniref:uncharacterized protein LOC127832344 isoform X3 n=1 Tax=Dreissena polymorpha TaxID=45954 RepID=UPI002263F44B|nr:uncharacterized protein LOC127832344 isoform X3 [Dreissena polymorpha]
MLNLDTSLYSRGKMSVLEPRMSDLRSGFGGMGFGLGTPGASGVSPMPLFPMWRPAPGPPAGLCTIPSCPCMISMSRPYFSSMPDLYDYASYSAYYAWCLKSAQESMYKGLAPPPLPTSGLLDRFPAQPSPPDICREPVDHRASPGKQLPSKINKHERIRTWLEVSSKPQKYEKEPAISSHQPNGSSHLTLRSVSPPDHYRNVEPVRGSEVYSLHPQTLLSSQQMLRSPPPHPPPGYPGSLPDSPHDRPLNLTVNNGNRQRNSIDGRRCDSQSPLSRPSVITCVTVPDRKYETASNGSFSPAASDSETGVDPAIEEHFRRSLGQRYPEYLAKSQSATPSPPPSYASTTLAVPTTPIPQPYAQHVESVDDHFARALGDSTWSALKAQKGEPAEPGSVDDHFAKALGETWLKLKAEKDSPTRPPPPPFPISHSGLPITHSGLPQSIARSVPHPHVLTHAVPQRPTSSSPPSHHSPIIST